VTGRHQVPHRGSRRALPAVLSLALVTVALGGSAGTVVGAHRNTATASAIAILPPDDDVPTPRALFPRAAPAPVLPAEDATRVLAEVSAAAAGAGGRVTVVVADPHGRPLLSSPEAAEPIYTASLIKLHVVAGLLERDASGAAALGTDDLALMHSALVTSDDSAMSALWVRHDGPRLVADVSAQLGLTGTAPPAVQGQWGEATTTARDVAVLLSSLDEVLDDADAATMLGWLHSTSTTAADGFDQAFGLLSGVPGPVGAKQGWMCCVDGGRQLHSAGVLEDGRVVVLLGQFPRSTSWSAARTALDGATAAVLDGIG